MRAVLMFGLLVALCASSEAATLHRSKPPARHLRPIYVSPIPRASVPQATVPKGFAVPGWTNEQTRYWLDSASGPKG